MKLQGWAVAGKSWVALLGSLLSFIVPWVVQVSANLPQPWPALIGAAVALATAFGVYRAPYAPVAGSTTAPGGTPWPKS